MSTLTPARLAAWDAIALGTSARSLRGEAELLREIETVVLRAVAAIVVGRGLTAEAQRRQGFAHAILARRVADVAELDAEVVQAASEVIGAALRLLQRALRLAGQAGLAVDRDGRVDPGPDPDDERLRLADTCSALARQALAAAEEADADAARSLSARDGVRDGLALFGPVPYRAGLIAAAAARVRERALPPGATVADRTGWWEATPAQERQRLLSHGLPSAEGLPPSVRDAVNRAQLSAELIRVRRRLAEAGRRPTPAELVLRDRLRVLLSVQAALSKHPDARLLSLDVTSGHGRAVVSVGDLERSQHVAVLVPGLGGWVDSSLGGLVDSAQRVRAKAEGYGRGSVAAVAWIGYEAPGFHDVALSGAAERGVPALRATLEALQARADTQGRGQSVTLVGHSYGSVLAGLTSRVATGIDDLVLLGSPGVGAHRVSELAVPAAHVWVGEGRLDQVADLGRFGADPSFPQFGATTLPTGSGIDPVLGTPVTRPFWHLQYYAAGTASLASVGLVVAGRGALLRAGPLAPGPFPRPTVMPGAATREAPRRPR